MKWPIITIAEIVERGEADLQTGPFGTQLKASDYVEEGVPVINVRNIGYGKIREEKLEFIDERTAERLKVHLLKKGDIVFGRKGSSDRHVLIDEKIEGWLQGSDCLRLRIKSDLVCNQYFSYYFDTSGHKDWMEAMCSFGATMTSLNQDIVRRIKIPLPPIETQKKIAAILSAYDDLIENNQRRIALLERLAEELYREWFVRMRFPGHAQVKFEKGVPEGWEEVKLGDIYTTSSGGTPSRANPSYYNGAIPWIKTGELQNTFITDSDEKITEAGLQNSSAKLFPRHTVLIAMYGATIGELGILSIEATTNQACCAFMPKLPDLKYVYTFHLLKSIKESLISFSFGGAQQNISQELIKNFRITLPKAEIIESFVNKTTCIYDELETVAKTQNVLRKTRDLLLPRLISGKFSVENLDIQFPPRLLA